MEIKIENSGHGPTMFKDLDVGKKILNVLEKHYALHPWFVSVSHEAGTASVQLMYEGGDKKIRIWKYGFLLHLNKLDEGMIEKKIMRAGGEVLERYNMARRMASENDIIDFMHHGVELSNMVQ